MGLAPPQAGMAASEVPQMLPEALFGPIGGALGRRWVERCCPTTRHARRCDTPNRAWSRSTATRRRSGVTIFPQPAP